MKKYMNFVNEGNLKPVDILLRNKREDLTYTITKEPFMVKNNLWWFIIKDSSDYIFDITVSTKELYELYGDITNLSFDEFVTKTKAGELNLKNLTINEN